MQKRTRRKKGIQELSQDDLEILNIYKQAYKRSYEDARLKEQDLSAKKHSAEK